MVRRLKSDKGYSQERFAEVCRIDRLYMGMIERGEVSVTLVVIAKLAGGLELSLSALVQEMEQDSDNPQGK
ncbi:MAG: hypothetical protein AVDCRST_MAG37-2144 [uncultured Rubrobacteraceae bacterium]|uniref:HTH cro/C1-type domain-containing protein n=1 Tax=uncultured Rubrobacteraceae bacterium TaxID=349277 RepID=A0A6J4QNP8_9ACTN|nr:MAG: hypothetical protein AVDCRST_MAG37-2144 [uncultured Rubrobacteraceae bacterium]